MSMIVYGSGMSPFVRKVLAAASEKGLAVEHKPVGLGSPNPDFAAASPFRKMPALRDGDFMVSDSSAIVHYFEAIRPEPALIPSDARARATTIWFDEFADTILAAAAGAMFFNRIVSPRFLKTPGDLAAADKAEHETLPPILDYLERVLPASGHLVADRLTLADIAVASPFVNLAHCDYRPDPARHPKLAAFVEAMLARSSFAPLVAAETAFFAA